MECTLKELRGKEVINIYNGERLGFIDDIKFSTENNQVISFIIYGRERLFGILGKQNDILIHCNQIHLVGEETVLVSVESIQYEDNEEKRSLLHKFFA
ncbi:MAG: YlmC/YmxH family sporulation protein [Oscillospiraceae bacterium]